MRAAFASGMGWTNDHMTIGYLRDYRWGMRDLVTQFLETEPQEWEIFGEVREEGHPLFLYVDQGLYRWPLLNRLRAVSSRRHIPLHVSFGY